MPLLDVRNLFLYYRTRKGPVRAVDNVSFKVEEGTTLALVGESGCGKTSIGISILRVLPRNVYMYDGEVVFDGVNLMDLDDETFRREIRWRKISMVFQGAMNALNPVITIGQQVIEPLVLSGVDRGEALALAAEALKSVGLSEALLKRYPHELSGGMKQRVVIAMALIMRPKLVILDEPTSALDLITQANIMNLLKRLKKEHRLTYIFITHDLPLASELADYVAVMYAGKIVEIGTAEQIFLGPKHPYTKMLMDAVPTLRYDKGELKYIPGVVPSLIEPPPGCRFHPRCPFRKDVCDKREPEMKEIEKDHFVACHLY
ncbi:dipeptide/oligopeptide/nickel ABC transporter ATP-binding protein [Candidatus Geothermarchaeota archaeon ex4572_27]|nr:MAG: dipeptide/oligopeptide/nickel ABC transporter ATP-binding protein [Candidatus Geothermarchaeota archaeon ex4572_27]